MGQRLGPCFLVFINLHLMMLSLSGPKLLRCLFRQILTKQVFPSGDPHDGWLCIHFNCINTLERSVAYFSNSHIGFPCQFNLILFSKWYTLITEAEQIKMSYQRVPDEPYPPPGKSNL